MFCDDISNEARRLYHMFPEKPMKRPTREQWRDHNIATICYICLKGFKVYDPKVRDHCHYTGKYLGPAHGSCNLRYKIPNYILILFHSLSRYGAHLFIRKLGKKFNTRKTGVIAENKEKYISFNDDIVVDSYTNDSREVEEKKV